MKPGPKEINAAILELESLGCEVVPSVEVEGKVEILRVMTQTEITPGDRIVVWRQTRIERDDLPRMAEAIRNETFAPATN